MYEQQSILREKSDNFGRLKISFCCQFCIYKIFFLDSTLMVISRCDEHTHTLYKHRHACRDSHLQANTQTRAHRQPDAQIDDL